MCPPEGESDCVCVDGVCEGGEDTQSDTHKDGRMYMCARICIVKVTQSCPTLCDPMDYMQSLEFSRPEYWSG